MSDFFTVAEAIAGLVAGFVFATFIWALRGHFASRSIPAGMWVVSAVSAAAFVSYITGLAAAAPSFGQLGAGVAAQIAALALFAASVNATRRHRITLAFDSDAPTFLLRTGVYRNLRHPFYASYLMFWAGCCVENPTVATVACTTLLCALYVRAALAEERKFAASALARDYRAYRHQAGLFWPKLLRGKPRP